MLYDCRVTEDFDPKYSAKTVANASVKDQVSFLADNNLTLPTDMPSLIQRRVFVDFGLYIAIIIIALKIASAEVCVGHCLYCKKLLLRPSKCT